MHGLCAVSIKFISQPPDIVPDKKGLHITGKHCRKVAGLGQQFETHVTEMSSVCLAIYYNVVHVPSF